MPAWTKLSPRKAGVPAEEAEPAATADDDEVGDGFQAEEDIPFWGAEAEAPAGPRFGRTEMSSPSPAPAPGP